MTTSARAVVAPPGDKPLRVVDVELPDPGPHQLLVKIHATGICHSQLWMIDSPGRGHSILLGHEASGQVLATGGAVEEFDAGDEVLLSWMPRFVDGRDLPGVELQIDGYGSASTHNTFTWATHVLIDERFAVAAPTGVAPDLTSVLPCAVITGAGAVVNTAGVRAGETVAVFGLGGVGLSAVAAAHRVGAREVFAVDVVDEKLDLAKRFGASRTINSRNEDPVEVITRETPGPLGMVGVDHAIDCVALPQTLAAAMGAARSGVRAMFRGGTVTVVGVPEGTIEVPTFDFLSNEKRLQASFGGSCATARDIPLYARWYVEGDFPLDALITDRFGLDDVVEAVEALRAGHVQGRAIMELEPSDERGA